MDTSTTRTLAAHPAGTARKHAGPAATGQPRLSRRGSTRAGLASGVLQAAALLALALPGLALAQSGSMSWDTPGSYTWMVPPGVTSVDVEVTGGGGGGGYRAALSDPTGRGGSGGMVTHDSWPVTPGQTINIVVGGGGGLSYYDAGGAGGGGGGGGSSLHIAQTDSWIIAGGGGGSGFYGDHAGGDGCGAPGGEGTGEHDGHGGAGGGSGGTDAGGAGGVGYAEYTDSDGLSGDTRNGGRGSGASNKGIGGNGTGNGGTGSHGGGGGGGYGGGGGGGRGSADDGGGGGGWTGPAGSECKPGNNGGARSNRGGNGWVKISLTTFTIGGNISGLNAAGLQLAVGTTPDQTVSPASGATTFTFPIPIDSGDYNVTVTAQPNGHFCTVSNGSGTVNRSNVTNVQVTCVSAPTVTTEAASNLAGTSATLNGTAAANYAQTSITFEYGTDTNYGTDAAATPATIAVTPDNAAVAVSADLSGLVCNTTYHYRAVATNSQGTTNGADATFTTTACVPDAPAITGVVAGDTQATVAFTAPANHGGAAITGYTVSCIDGGGTAAGTDGDADTLALSHVITGLTNGTAYTCTVTATNAAGSSVLSAPSASFTPQAPPVAEVAPIPTLGEWGLMLLGLLAAGLGMHRLRRV